MTAAMIKENHPKPARALALMSGGLDSQLAVCVLKEQGIHVEGICFESPFFGADRARRAARQAGVELHVVDPAEPCNIEINVVDPQRQWLDRCTALAKTGSTHAPVHVVPPLANTIRAYPDNELAQVLAQVREGAVAIFFEPPDDWNDLADRVDPGIRATSKDSVGGFLGVYHYVKLHPVFDGLPARGRKIALTRPGITRIAERGRPEIVLNEGNIQKYFPAIAGGGDRPIVINNILECDGYEFARIAAKYMPDVHRNYGTGW